MKSTIWLLLVAAALGSLLSGCSHNRVTAANAAPGVIPGDNRQAMIQWHRQHDKKPATTTPGG